MARTPVNSLPSFSNEEPGDGAEATMAAGELVRREKWKKVTEI